ncbi:putative disease resistance protein At1g50180 isoform X1 [Magnolia sinica]|uniref:putative disease resistance protein At1g50180 isoform X1 n=1 Tax=Magnolia sinica TaxID=86752 RepID=UPI0026583091|nr:putative disease resistance protein At1g50180 isoform X1 [Magnolia sinica]XP_058114515.1 putative disease resistance protein At1g50180 isoform X1 [Magnolia sinica]XP_058114516.1 putative disease resistance protein At1g50180 isoform X1 [Magnolia sinica]XP_058114517.1 putative disease resistance protein At1g50180 isoform X1 [Magnolia sinica]XP_058114518.1 putative disease resistance protein At1g50180 isoform X1 [Magnolia sinica]
MSIVESIVKLLLQKLADPILQEAIFLYGVGDQVEWLEAEFKRMQCFLEDADAKQEGDRRVKGWVGDVRDVAYDAEDVIDTILFKVANLRRTGIKRYACIFNELKPRHEVGSKIERIKAKIRAISESRSTYGIENIGQGAGTSSSGLSLQEWRLTSPLSQETDFVGFEKELEMLVAQLTEGELRRCVVSVVGMGGLGKTTLTKKLYNANTVKKHFHTHAWISVSQEYSARDLLRVFVRRWRVVSDKAAEKLNIAELRDKISEYLNDKRYLVVLDDIWKREAWDALKDAFPDANNGSRVMLTTRIKDVASYADRRSQPHELRFLTNEESWDLFRKKTFAGQDGGWPPDYLEKLGREIVEKCHGLPLAIAVIGGLLSGKEPREWDNVRKSISWQFVEGEVQISSILSLSYKDLPYYLKPCFLYLGNFPEDYEFHANELIGLWAAEGFLKERGELTLEEVGEDYLMQLVQRSMVQLTRRNSSRGIKSCRIHDLLRDLSISEAKESKFLEVRRDNGNAPSASRARRLAIHLNEPKYISLSSSHPHLRSVLIYIQGYTSLQKEQSKFLFQGFKLLRVLYLAGVEIRELPKQIGELIHLRYLRCTKTELETLPSSIGNLINLQTLFLQSINHIVVPDTIGKMHQLRHLRLPGNKPQIIMSTGSVIEERHFGVIQGHPRLDLISNLQTLYGVYAGKWMEGCLGKLTNLREIKILFETGADAELFSEAIVNLNCLHHLWARMSVPIRIFEGSAKVLPLPNLSHLLKLSKLYWGGKLETFPEFPTNLTKLTLEWSGLKEDPMATLEKLKSLRILKLLGASYDGVEMACSAQGFPQLESLHLQALCNLKEWRVEEGAMPSLLHLWIGDCKQLKKLPEGLQHVTTLKKLELWWMRDEFNARVREDGGEDWYKIRHIPSIDIQQMIRFEAFGL